MPDIISSRLLFGLLNWLLTVFVALRRFLHSLTRVMDPTNTRTVMHVSPVILVELVIQLSAPLFRTKQKLPGRIPVDNHYLILRVWWHGRTRESSSPLSIYCILIG